MKRNLVFGIIAFSVILLSSCRAILTGNSTNGTTINLSEANFSYVQKGLVGHSKATYILSIGGFNHDGLIKEAKENMVRMNSLKDNQAIANMTIDIKNKFLLFGLYQQEICTISADIIEFRKK